MLEVPCLKYHSRLQVPLQASSATLQVSSAFQVPGDCIACKWIGIHGVEVGKELRDWANQDRRHLLPVTCYLLPVTC